MKKPLKILAVILILTIAAAGIAWWISAGQTVTQAAQAVARFNQQAAERGTKLTLRYERLARGGFPVSAVRVINPTLEYTAPGETEAKAVWNYRGEVLIGPDYLRHGFRVLSEGHGETTITTGDEKTVIASIPSRLSLFVKANSYAAFSRWNRLDFTNEDAIKQALQDIALLQLVMDPIELKNTTSGEVLMRQEYSFLTLVNRSHDELTDFDLTASMPGSELTPAYAALLAHIGPAFQLPDMGPLAAMTAAGPQVLGLDLTVTLPHIFAQKPVSNGHISARYATLRNNFYELQLPTNIRFVEADGRRSVFIKTNWKWHLTPAGAAEMRRSLAQAVPFVTTTVSSEELQQKIEAALPEMAALGPIVLTTDIEAGVPMSETIMNAKPGTLGEMLAINQFAFGHERWGIDAKGLAQRSKGSEPLVDLTLHCNHCDALTGDIFTAARQWEDVLRLTDPAHTPWNVDAKRQAQVEGLLAEIGQKNPETGDIVFAIATPTAGDTRINNQPIATVMAKIMAIFMPEAAPAPAQPSP